MNSSGIQNRYSIDLLPGQKFSTVGFLHNPGRRRIQHVSYSCDLGSKIRLSPDRLVRDCIAHREGHCRSRRVVGLGSIVPQPERCREAFLRASAPLNDDWFRPRFSRRIRLFRRWRGPLAWAHLGDCVSDEPQSSRERTILKKPVQRQIRKRAKWTIARARWGGPIRDYLRSQPAWVDYAERMRARFFPELAS